MSIIRVKRCFVDFHRATLYQPDAYIVLLHCAALHVQHETESFQVSQGMRHHFSGCRRVTMQSTAFFSSFFVFSLDVLYSGKNFLSCCVGVGYIYIYYNHVLCMCALLFLPLHSENNARNLEIARCILSVDSKYANILCEHAPQSSYAANV